MLPQGIIVWLTAAVTHYDAGRDQMGDALVRFALIALQIIPAG
jgi:hypothetical protein